MAYALPGEARITVPPPPPPVGLIDPGTLILSPPPPVAYLVPLGAIPRHGHQGAVFVQNPVLVPRNHSLVSPPVILRLNPAFLMQMDEHRTRSLLQYVNVFDPSLLAQVDDTSWRSLSGVRANKRILQLVPNLKVFVF
ncbi:hypothetical protein B296_00024292 [Ensete ventricosum]|uniref:Uncharacterized protein n=1 Tax=Ensete ventricosum TaxID=4639 RepID=A0A427ACV9_ENSVE|nr:hypothetical protein B296_00024292 [Ensete ventricosum]